MKPKQTKMTKNKRSSVDDGEREDVVSLRGDDDEKKKKKKEEARELVKEKVKSVAVRMKESSKKKVYDQTRVLMDSLKGAVEFINLSDDDGFDGTAASLLKIQRKDEYVRGMKCLSELICQILRLGYKFKHDTMFFEKNAQNFLVIWMGKF